MGFLNFKHKKKKEKTFEQELIDEIRNYNKQIITYETEIHNIKKFASDLIHSTLFVPKEYEFEELENYQKILNNEQNKGIPENEKDEIAELCTSYLNHLLIRQKKIEVFVKNRDKLIEMLKEEKKLNNQINREQSKRQFKIDEHKKIVQKFGTADIEQVIESNEKLKLIEDELNNLRKELNKQKIISKELKKLYNKYSDLSDLPSAQILLEELNKLIK